MTSVGRERGWRDDPAALWGDTRAAVIEAFGETFDLEPVEGDGAGSSEQTS
jgi:hypothetical protein